MAILVGRKVWHRPRPERERAGRLSPEQSENVRRAMVVLQRRFPSVAAYAGALGMSAVAYTKARSPGRRPGVTHAYAVAELAGVPMEDVIGGKWPGNACPTCGHPL
jgi:hypothetical protein